MPKRSVPAVDPVRLCVLVDREDAVQLDRIAADLASTRSAAARVLLRHGLAAWRRTGARPTVPPEE